MDVPASQPAVSAEEEFAIDEAFECDAPTYAEFPDALHDMSNVDSWFGTLRSLLWPYSILNH